MASDISQKDSTQKKKEKCVGDSDGGCPNSICLFGCSRSPGAVQHKRSNATIRILRSSIAEPPKKIGNQLISQPPEATPLFVF